MEGKGGMIPCRWDSYHKEDPSQCALYV